MFYLVRHLFPLSAVLFLGTFVPHKNAYLASRVAPLWCAAGVWEVTSSCGGNARVKSQENSVSVPPFSHVSFCGIIFTHANILTR